MNEQDVPNIDSKSPSTLPKRHTSQPQQLTSEMPSGRQGLVVVKCRPAGKDSGPPHRKRPRHVALGGNAIRPGRTRGRPHRKRPRHALADALCQPKPATQFRYDVEESFPAGRHFRLRYCPMSWSLSVGTTTSPSRPDGISELSYMV